MISAPAEAGRRVWGLTVDELHDRYWASFGVQVVRAGDASQRVSRRPELYLLLQPGVRVLFGLKPCVEVFNQLDVQVVRVRVADGTHDSYAERLLADESGGFVRFERIYDARGGRALSAVLTTNREIAGNWSVMEPGRGAMRTLRSLVPRWARVGLRTQGKTFTGGEPEDEGRFVRALVEAWEHPEHVVPTVQRLGESLIAPSGAEAAWTRSAGRVWLGAGRELPEGDVVVGPAVMWDAPGAEVKAVPVDWDGMEAPPRAPREAERIEESDYATGGLKRCFDVVFASLALVALLPLFPLVALAVAIEDGWPVLFVHRRETLGGREFGCIKFRTMYRNAEKMKAELAARNIADGAHFYIEDDPRVTRVGRVLRKLQIDELPQLVNVLTGSMSIVGPRPSPRRENQFNPAWREARLSVRPGLTGLWQVRRTRAMGSDFQEWIKYDVEYVERASLMLDLKLIVETIMIVLRPLLRR